MKKGCFATGLVTQFLNCITLATRHIYSAIHYNLITTLLQQLIFNYYATPL
jgi:hypothetical protein